MKLAIHPSSVALQSVSAFLGGAFVMALQGPVQSPGHQDAQALPSCAKTIEDVTTGNCISADSTPTLGSLYPMSPDLNVDPGGNVGIGTTVPSAKLDVAGGAHFDGSMGIGTDSPQAGLHLVTSQYSTASLLVGQPGLASAGSIRCDAEYGAELTLASEYPGSSKLIFAYNDNTPAITFCMDYDNNLFGIDYQRFSSNAYGILGFNQSFTDNGLGPEVSVGGYPVYQGGSGAAYFEVGPATLRVNGNASQTLSSGGFVKAGCHINGTTIPPTVDRFFNNLPLWYGYLGGYTAQVARVSEGVCSVSFLNADPASGDIVADLSSRFFQATLGSATNASVSPGFIQVHPGTNSVIVETFDVTGQPADNQFYLAVY